MPRSLRSKLILASVLWTAGLLMLMHMLSLMVIHAFPRVRGFHNIGAILVGLGLMAGGVLGLRKGLAPFQPLRARLMAIRSGAARRVQGEYPAEVQPLIHDLNALLEDREKAVKRAVATAGDLAHGLKTPLAMLVREADCARTAGSPELADNILQQVERMSRQVDYHLARARAAGVGSLRRRQVRGRFLRRRLGAHRFEALRGPRAQNLVDRGHRSFPRGSSARISTRCSAICWTTPANGPDPQSC
jgi:hypothetical protein